MPSSSAPNHRHTDSRIPAPRTVVARVNGPIPQISILRTNGLIDMQYFNVRTRLISIRQFDTENPEMWWNYLLKCLTRSFLIPILFVY